MHAHIHAIWPNSRRFRQCFRLATVLFFSTLLTHCDQNPQAEKQLSTEVQRPTPPLGGEQFNLTDSRSKMTYTGNLLIWDKQISPEDMRDMISFSKKRFDLEQDYKIAGVRFSDALAESEAIYRQILRLKLTSNLDSRPEQIAAFDTQFKDFIKGLRKKAKTAFTDEHQARAERALGYYCQAKIFELALTPWLRSVEFLNRPSPAVACESYYRSEGMLSEQKEICAAVEEGDAARSYLACVWQEGVFRTVYAAAMADPASVLEQAQKDWQAFSGQLQRSFQVGGHIESYLELDDSQVLEQGRVFQFSPDRLAEREGVSHTPKLALSIIESTGKCKNRFKRLPDELLLIKKQQDDQLDISALPSRAYRGAERQCTKDIKTLRDPLERRQHLVSLQDILLNFVREDPPYLERPLLWSSSDIESFLDEPVSDSWAFLKDPSDEGEVIDELRDRLSVLNQELTSLNREGNRKKAIVEDFKTDVQNAKAREPRVALAVYETMEFQIERVFAADLLVTRVVIDNSTDSTTSEKRASSYIAACASFSIGMPVECPDFVLSQPEVKQFSGEREVQPGTLVFDAETGKMLVKFDLHAAKALGFVPRSRLVQGATGENPNDFDTYFADVSSADMQGLTGRIEVYAHRLKTGSAALLPSADLGLLTGDLFFVDDAGEYAFEASVRLNEDFSDLTSNLSTTSE